ncbi:MAG: peptidylprolyl isomerase [Frankiales bacterium]|nr:peptidylprolyl isomerase [Frankiales bacterium]
MTRPTEPTRPATPTASVAAAVLVVALVVAAVVYLAQRNDEDSSPSASTGSAVRVGSCTYERTPDPAAKAATPPTGADLRTGAVTATLNTTVGALTVQLDGAAAPCATTSFVSLARQGFYDGTPCHRLVADPGGPALLQCGDPTGSGSGGPGYDYAEEALDGATYPAGTVAVAKTAAPGTSGSQFFIVIADVPLSSDYTPVGRVTAGLQALLPVAAAGSTPEGDGAPNTPVKLSKVTTR